MTTFDSLLHGFSVAMQFDNLWYAFLGCVVGVRVLPDDMVWYGEGEFKFYRDGDDALPTICGTGLEDYVGTAWGMGQHAAPYQGAPLIYLDGQYTSALED